MNRISRGNKVIKKRKKLFKSTKSFYGSQSKLYSIAKQRYMKSKIYSFADRRKKKYIYKRIWMNRINAGLKQKNMKYSKSINTLKNNKININKKIISKITLIDPETFYGLLKKI